MTEPRTPTGRRTVAWDESPAMRERVLEIESEAAALDVAGHARWPRPEDFDRMSPEEFEAYAVRIGLDERIAAARAEAIPE